MQAGSFYVLVQRQSAVPHWLLPFARKFGSEHSLAEKFHDLVVRVEKSSKKNQEVDAEVLAAPCNFYFPGGAFGVALQETLQIAGGLSLRKQPSCFSTKHASIVFQGYLSNLDELIEELLYGSSPEAYSTSYESEHGKGSFQLKSRGDQALLSAEVILHMFLRSSHGNLPILLSELQGQYSFVIYDSSKRQLFAARDPNGKEALFVNHEEDGALAFTNEPTSAWGTTSTWQEVLPGHFLGGKNPKQVQQFALTPQQLHMREYAESLEEMSSSCYSGYSIAVPIKDHLLSQDEDRTPSSARSSTELVSQVDHLFRISV